MFSLAAIACDRPGDAHAAPGGPLPAPARDLPAGDAAEARAVFAGGCFWCTEAVFEQLQGVSAVVSGYAGGKADTANYDAVCSGQTDHAEAIEITYDPRRITFGQLLQVFFALHDPTQLNRQGPDHGRQYRSAVFYHSAQEREVAQAYIDQLNAAKAFGQTIVTTLEPLTKFYSAEEYHQDYVRRHPNQPYVAYNALPKVAKVCKLFPKLVKPEAK